VEELEARRKALDTCLQKLPPASRSLVEACYAGDRSIREVAKSFGRPAKAVYKALGRIRDVLTNCVNSVLKDG
jgi:RNA polymerase sigma-70 factor (ECF subfamily)